MTITRAQLAALLGIVTVNSPAPFFAFDEQPVYYDPDGPAPRVLPRGATARLGRMLGEALKVRGGW